MISSGSIDFGCHTQLISYASIDIQDDSLVQKYTQICSSSGIQSAAFRVRNSAQLLMNLHLFIICLVLEANNFHCSPFFVKMRRTNF